MIVNSLHDVYNVFCERFFVGHKSSTFADFYKRKSREAPGLRGGEGESGGLCEKTSEYSSVGVRSDEHYPVRTPPARRRFADIVDGAW